MLIVGQISSLEEAAEIECIAKSFVIARRIKALVRNQITG